MVQKMVLGWLRTKWSRVQNILSSTRSALTQRIRGLFGRKVDESLIEELEEILYEADLGVNTIKDLISHVRALAQKNPDLTVNELLTSLEQILLDETAHLSCDLRLPTTGPSVFLIIGANGSGKTTSIARITKCFLEQKKTVLLAAADTFRAAAQEQLAIWADRLDVPIIRAKYQADPAAVAFDAISAAISRNIDILLIDTAGRLENKETLLEELKKIKRSCSKALSEAPHEVLLVLDATIGQNGIEQARAFNQAAPITGIILTKLDGSAKGGSVVAIQK